MEYFSGLTGTLQFTLITAVVGLGLQMGYLSDPPGIIQAILVTISTILAYTAGVWIYRIFLHPLQRYPGPLMCAASELPLLLERWSGRGPEYVHLLHLKYGPVVRVGPYEISYISANAWKDIYGHKIGDRGNIEKDYEMNIHALGGRDAMLWASEEDHKRQRRLLSHAFSDKAIREQEIIIRQYVDLMVSRMSSIISTSNGSAVFNMVDWFSFASFDIIADLAFSQDLGMLREGKWNPWMGAMFASLKGGRRMSYLIRYMPVLAPFIRSMAPESMVEAGKMHVREVTKQIEARLARKTDRPDFWTYVLRHQGQDDKSQMTKLEMHAAGKTLMVAGTETTATLLAGMTYLLISHPDKLAKLVREIRGAFASSDEIDMGKTSKLKYLHACIEEALRIYPPGAVSMPRLVPRGGRMIDGGFVPAETTVYMSPFAAFRSENHFAEPLEYIPERWLDEQLDKRFANDQREVMQPFSFGPRNCLGKNLAYHESRLIFATLLWHFDLHDTGEKGDDWLAQENYSLWQKHPLMLKLTIAPQVNATKTAA